MTDQPTPTSSLEEARKRTINGAFNRELHELMGGMADIEAAARAEVIREVEAALKARCERTYLAYRGPLAALEAFAGDLRALSQGGE